MIKKHDWRSLEKRCNAYSDIGRSVVLMLFLAFGVPLLLIIIGIAFRNKNKKVSKALLISAVVYVLIGLGVCGSMMI